MLKASSVKAATEELYAKLFTIAAATPSPTASPNIAVSSHAGVNANGSVVGGDGAAGSVLLQTGEGTSAGAQFTLFPSIARKSPPRAIFFMASNPAAAAAVGVYATTNGQGVTLNVTSALPTDTTFTWYFVILS